MMLAQLDVDVLSEIASHLTPLDTVRIIQCCRSLAALNHSDLVYQQQCRSWYGCHTKPSACDSWRATLINLYREFPAPYLPHYRVVASLLDRLMTALEKKLPRVRESLLPGVSRQHVKEKLAAALALQAHMNCVPYDWLTLMQLCGGQSRVVPGSRHTYFSGIFGGYIVYDFIVNERLMPFDAVIATACQNADHACHPALLPTLPVALLPLTVNNLGQLQHSHRTAHCAFYLDQQGRVVRRMQQSDRTHAVVHGESFTQFFESFVARVEADEYRVWDPLSAGLVRIPFTDAMGSVAVTEGIRVRVSVLYMPEQSLERDDVCMHQFTYRITIDHAADAQSVAGVRARLTTRHWRITDGHGNEEMVEGPGVIGEFPYIYPGCEPFHYQSLTRQKTRTGSMQGHFTFQVDDSERTIDVRVAPFHFDPARNAC